MGAITGTLTKITELGGDYKLLSITAQLAATSDTITLSASTGGITEIMGVVGCLQGGLDANLAFYQVSYSSLTITIVTKGADGNAATNWTGGIVQLFVLGK